MGGRAYICQECGYRFKDDFGVAHRTPIMCPACGSDELDLWLDVPAPLAKRVASAWPAPLTEAELRNN
jgi:DNA-directed RNA polymerase subunit RPC12/RpoP